MKFWCKRADNGDGKNHEELGGKIGCPPVVFVEGL